MEIDRGSEPKSDQPDIKIEDILDDGGNVIGFRSNDPSLDYDLPKTGSGGEQLTEGQGQS